jgi:hypothetical protein
MFADDAQIAKSITKTLNSDLTNISDWMAANKLSLNQKIHACRNRRLADKTIVFSEHEVSKVTE